MTSDHENDEIRDSAFPVAFNDEMVTLDQYGVWVKSGPRDAVSRQEELVAEPVQPEAEVSPETGFTEISALSDLSELPDLPDFSEETVAEETAAPFEGEILTFAEPEPPVPESFVSEEVQTSALSPEAPAPSIDTTVFENAEPFDIQLPEETEIPVFGAETASPAAGLAEAEPHAEVPAEEDFSSFLEGLNSGESVDVSDFMGAGASSAPSSSGTDDLDLDSFVSSFNESSATEEVEKLFEDVTPVDIDLDFDESFIADAEKIRSKGTSITASEFENAEFGVELIDETGKAEQKEAEKKIAAKREKTVAEGAPQSVISACSPESMEATSEFDDLLATLDSSIVPTTAKQEKTGPASRQKTYDLSVDEEDGSSSISAPVVEFSEEEDIEVPLFGSEEEAEQILHAPQEASQKVTLQPSKDVEFNPETIPEFDRVSVSGEAMPEFDREPVSGEEMPEFTLEPLDLGETPPGFGEETATPSGSVAGPDAGPVSGQEAEENSGRPDRPFPEEELIAEQSPEVRPEELDLSALAEMPGESPEETIENPENREYNQPESAPGVGNLADLKMEEGVSVDFDDISALEQELNETASAEYGEKAEGVISDDKSTMMLMKIAEELSSIKQELSTLKTELAGYKAAGTVPEPVPESVVAPVDEKSGFFSDDDTDETIALTGDELNNILITADFTEEKGVEGIPEELPESFGEPEVAPAGETEPPAETSEASLPEQPFDSASELNVTESLPEDMFSIPDLDTGAPVEVSHVNKLNDDISYLEGSEVQEPDLDNVAIEEPDLEIIDFEDEKLEEPELTEFNIDLTEIEKGFLSPQDESLPSADNFSVPEETGTAGPAAEPITVGDLLETGGSASGLFVPAPEGAVSLTEEKEQEEPIVEEMLPEISLETEEQPAAPFSPAGMVAPPMEGMPETGTPAPVAETEISAPVTAGVASLPIELKDEIKSVLSYMDQLLESLPEEKIEEFAKSEHFEIYKKLFEELGIS